MIQVHLCQECGVQFAPADWSSRAHTKRCISASFEPPALTEYQEPPRRTEIKERHPDPWWHEYFSTHNAAEEIRAGLAVPR